MNLFLLVSCLLVFVCGSEKNERPERDMNEFVPLNYGQLWGITQVKGIREKSISGKIFYSFMSIPFAEPPVEKLRLKDPVPIEPWQGTRDATHMPEPCLQANLGGKTVDSAIGSEDCLYLNVFTPKPKENSANLPVMVYIHGGGFYVGSAADYKPHVLLNKDIVLVVLQYRLGALGFLSTGDEVIPGNFGLKDQTLALQWVQDHISQFGGNPKSVTIFGESAGASSCHFQMMTPYAKGLFQRAILQSGNALTPWASGEAHAGIAVEMGNFLHCPPNASSQQLLECFQRYHRNTMTLSIVLFMDIMNWPREFLPRVDGDYLPDYPEVLMMQGKYHKVDVMAGVTRDEGAFYTAQAFSLHEDKFNEDLIKYLSIVTGFHREDNDEELTKQTMAYFLNDKPYGPDTINEITEMFTARHFHYPHDFVTQQYIKRSEVDANKLYTYELKHEGEQSFYTKYPLNITHNKWIGHVDDLFYLFDETHSSTSMTSSDDLKIRRIIVNAWTNFAADGNPTPEDSEEFTWNAVSQGSNRHLSITLQPYMEDDSRIKQQQFLSSLPTKQNRLIVSTKSDPDQEAYEHLKTEL